MATDAWEITHVGILSVSARADGKTRIELRWEVKGQGFGTVALTQHHDGSTTIETETLPKSFVSRLFTFLIDHAHVED